MNARDVLAVRRIAVALLLAAGLGGCAVYAPPYAAYDSTYPAYGYPAYGYPAYAGPPITFDLGLGYYSGHRHHHRGHHHHGWRSHGGHKHGWQHHKRGGWRHGRGHH